MMSYPPQFKQDAVRMLLKEKRDAAKLSQLLGVPVRTLLDWQTEIRTHDEMLYQQMIADSHATKREQSPSRPVVSYTQKLDDAYHRIRQLKGINRSLRLCVLDLRSALMAKIANRSVTETSRILRCWQQLPPRWRLAAAVHAGVHTLEELQEMNPAIKTEEVLAALEQLRQPHTNLPILPIQTPTKEI